MRSCYSNFIYLLEKLEHLCYTAIRYSINDIASSMRGHRPLSTSHGTVMWSFGKGGGSMFDLFFSSQRVALSASVCSLQRPFLDAACPKAIKKENVCPLHTLAVLPATFCIQAIRPIGLVVFCYRSFRKEGSCGFKPSNQATSNVTSVTTEFKKTHFFSQKCRVPTTSKRSGHCKVRFQKCKCPIRLKSHNQPDIIYHYGRLGYGSKKSRIQYRRNSGARRCS